MTLSANVGVNVNWNWTYVHIFYTFVRMTKSNNDWRSPQGKRETILAATLEAIGTGGIDSVTHRYVAEIAGVATGSVGYHFETRETLIREAFRYYVKGISDTVLMIGDPPEPPTKKDILDILVAISERDLDRPEFLRAEYEMMVYAGRDPQLAREIASWHEALEGRLAGLLEAFGVDKPIQAARMIRDLVRGIEIDRLVQPQQSRNRLRTELDLALSGLCVSEPA